LGGTRSPASLGPFEAGLEGLVAQQGVDAAVECTEPHQTGRIAETAIEDREIGMARPSEDFEYDILFLKGKEPCHNQQGAFTCNDDLLHHCRP
jgi:hypothetical protein